MRTEFQNCTIIRNKIVTHSSFNVETGVDTPGRTENRTEDCGVPLFDPDEKATGICKSCRKGWESEGNTFAEGQRERTSQ